MAAARAGVAGDRADVVLAVDCGTHAVRSLAFDVGTGRHQVCASADLPLTFPRPGWVEIDPEMLAAATVGVLRAALRSADAHGSRVVGLGLTNMRETAFAWRRSTGEALYPGIMWMSRQSEPVVERWATAGHDALIRARSGLTNHSFFFGSKVAWLLEHDDGVRRAADEGDLAVGTVDAWLLHRLTGGTVHATDVSNGSRYQVMGLAERAWDPTLCAALGIPAAALPDLRPSAGDFGATDGGVCGAEVPITGVIADQQASLLGHGCEAPGDVKATFGTSGVVALNCGEAAPACDGLVTSVGWTDAAGRTCYEVEGSAFHSGYTVQWLSDRLVASDAWRTSLERSPHPADDRVYVLPSFSSLGAPRWPERGGAVISGLRMDSSVDDIMRAALEAMAFQAHDLLLAMGDVAPDRGDVVVDGGGAASDYLCRLLADLTGRDVVRPALHEITSAGAAKAALDGAGVERDRYFGQDRDAAVRFTPGTDRAYAATGFGRWVELIETVLR